MTLISAGLIGERRNLTFRVFATGGGKEGKVKDVRTEVGLPFCSYTIARFALQSEDVVNWLKRMRHRERQGTVRVGHTLVTAVIMVLQLRDMHKWQ